MDDVVITAALRTWGGSARLKKWPGSLRIWQVKRPHL